MKAYPEVPEWMYLAFLLVCTAGMCFVGAFTPFVMPWWSVLLAVLIAAVTILPTGIIFAITGTQIGLNVLSELVIGFIAPGQTVTVMAFKSLSYNCQIQAFGLVSDLKISHYLKIPPRAMVIAQLYSTAIGSISTLVVTWLVMTTSFADTIGNNPDWTASSTYAVYYNAGAIWGAISPARFFGSDSPYFALLLGFPIGLVVPFIPWLLYKAYPSKFWLWINVPLILYVNSAGQLQTLIVVPFIVSWFFNYYLFNKHNDWWRKYMYVFAGATSAGVALCVVAIAILYNFTGAITPPNWTGNPVGDLFLRSWC